MHKYLIALLTFLLLGTYASAFYVVPQRYKNNFASLRASRIAPGQDFRTKKKQRKITQEQKFFSKKTQTPKNLATITPYRLSFHLEPQNLILQGFVPDIESKIELRDLAFALFPGRDITDRLKLGRGEPQKWRDASIDVLVFLKRFEAANATMVAKDILLKVPKGEQLKAKEIKTQLGLVLPASYKLTPLQTTKQELIELAQELHAQHLAKSKVSTSSEEKASRGKSASIEKCQIRFNKALAASKVEFESGSSEIKTQSNSLLNTLASIGESCDGLSFEIVGHTDSQGDEQFNQILSFSRAETVMFALGKRGLVLEQMKATGKGSKEPLASNESRAGKSKNRRVEILVKQGSRS